MEKDLYYVAVKVLLRDGNNLLVTHDIFGDWDIPGGRIRTGEFETPIPDIVKRKIDEELGPDVRYELGKPIVTFRVERFEHNLQTQVRIFAVGYEAIYLGGNIQLGDHHDEMKWVDVTTYDPADDFTGGWLKGLQDYLLIIRGQ